MRIDVVRDAFADSLINYIDSFQPSSFVASHASRLVCSRTVPDLIRSLSQEGLSVRVGHDLRVVAAIQQASRGRMRLVKANDPAFHPDASPANANVLVLSRHGSVVGCVASRLFWCENTLAEEMQSGRLWVSNPETMWGENDRCITTAYMAHRIRACPVAFIGSIYLDTEVTGGTTLAAMLRLHYLWLLCHWRWSWAVGLIEGALVRRHAFDVYGVMSLEIGVWRSRQGEPGLFPYHLTLWEREAAMSAWLRPEMGDLGRPMGRLPAAFDREASAFAPDPVHA